MNAVAIKRTAPRSVEELEAEASALERSLAETRRAESAARTRLSGLIAAGDAEAIRECRATIKECAAKIARELSDFEATQQAIKLAQERDRAAAHAQAYRDLKQPIAVARQEVCDLADSILTFANALKKAIGGLEGVEAQMRRAGVTPDPYVLRAKLLGMVAVGLHLETGGIVGEARTLESPQQLRQSGRANLKSAAREYETLTLQRVRSALGVTDG